MLERVVAPVLDNAVRHAAREVRVEATRDGARLRLVISDDGPGVPAEHRERVFEPGWQADPDDGHDGAGLGLALVRRLAAAAGAEVTVAESGTGARFVIDLPAG